MSASARPPDRPGADAWVPRPRSLKALHDAAQECRGCELFEGTTQAVMGDGPLHAELMVVGEQPGDREDQEGKPFVGPAGKLLDRALDGAGLQPHKVFRTNAVKHFRFSETRGKRRIHQSPDLAHMRACAPWLEAELALVRPRAIVLLGSFAGKAIFGSGFRVNAQRGRLLEWPEAWPGQNRPEWVVATIHPSAVLRSDDREQKFASLVHDLSLISEQLTG
jgi:uracil-DNA glycosylase